MSGPTSGHRDPRWCDIALARNNVNTVGGSQRWQSGPQYLVCVATDQRRLPR